MIEKIKFNRDAANADELCRHLSACDRSFSPPLSNRVDIPLYAEKLFREATRFEAWEEKTLVGLVASYQNDLSKLSAFITNVSVVGPWQGHGIGGRLLDQCIIEARRAHFTEIILDVSVSQTIAISLYKRRGFQERSTSNNVLSMHCSLDYRAYE